MIRRFALFVTSALAVVLMAGTAIAHPGHEKKVMGTVTMAAADHVMVKTPDGKDATVKIDAATKFVKAKKPMKASDMAVGMRIVITAETLDDDEQLLAKVIELGQAAAAK
jgi:hypothetical protein